MFKKLLNLFKLNPVDEKIIAPAPVNPQITDAVTQTPHKEPVVNTPKVEAVAAAPVSDQAAQIKKAVSKNAKPAAKKPAAKKKSK